MAGRETQAAQGCPRGAVVQDPASHAADAIVPAANVTRRIVGRGLAEPVHVDGLLLICIFNEVGAQPGSVLLCLPPMITNKSRLPLLQLPGIKGDWSLLTP